MAATIYVEDPLTFQATKFRLGRYKKALSILFCSFMTFKISCNVTKVHLRFNDLHPITHIREGRGVNSPQKTISNDV